MQCKTSHFGRNGVLSAPRRQEHCQSQKGQETRLQGFTTRMGHAVGKYPTRLEHWSVRKGGGVNGNGSRKKL